jgi:asparagine synthase (glutamine-hydrolysing)
MRFLRLIRMVLKRVKTRNFTRPAYNPRFLKAFQGRWLHQIVRREWVERFDLEKRYFDVAKFDAGYTDLKKFTLEKRWAPFVPTRMENCSLMAAARKIEYRWPLLDVRLVRLFLRLPAELHYHRGMGRHLHRRAMAGVVPDLVTWKKSKDMGNPAGGGFGGFGQISVDPDRLHERLAEMIDVEKLREQVAAAEKEGRVDINNRNMQRWQNIQAAANLDRWLKATRPAGG